MEGARDIAVVIGNVNIDYFYRVKSIPRSGETVVVHSRDVGHGGKGFNQALAMARSGISTIFIGAIGNDPMGKKSAESKLDG